MQAPEAALPARAGVRVPAMHPRAGGKIISVAGASTFA